MQKHGENWGSIDKPTKISKGSSMRLYFGKYRELEIKPKMDFSSYAYLHGLLIMGLAKNVITTRGGRSG